MYLFSPTFSSDNKHPLLFKLETHAQEVVALTSKTYVCIGFDNKLAKSASKGVSKRFVLQNDPLALYKQVLTSGVPNGATNRGFRAINGQMYTYHVWRSAFPFLYLKRDLVRDANGGTTHTSPLKIVLSPCPKIYICLQTDMKLLSADCDDLQFSYHGFHMKSIRQAHTFAKLNVITSTPFPSRSLQHIQMQRVTLQKNILQSSDPKTLHKILQDMGHSDEFARDEQDILRSIVDARMSHHPLLYRLIDLDSEQYIVNACQFNSVIGNGRNVLVTRYKKDAHLEGKNLLGKVYMQIRSQLKSMLR